MLSARRFLALAIILLGAVAAACIVVPTGGGGSDGRVKVGASGATTTATAVGAAGTVAAALAAALYQHLSTVESWFRDRRERLLADSPDPDSLPRREVERLLDETEEELTRAIRWSQSQVMRAEPSATGREVDPLLDWVSFRFGRLRTELRAEARQVGQAGGRQERGPWPASAAPSLASWTAFAPAPRAGAFRAGRQGFVPAEFLKRVLGNSDAVLTRLLQRAGHQELSVELCVRTHPSGATVKIWPASYPRGVRETKTDGALSSVFRGLYLYEIKLSGHRNLSCLSLPQGNRPECAPLNLMDDDQPVWLCDLGTPDGARTPGCSRRGLAPTDQCASGGTS